MKNGDSKQAMSTCKDVVLDIVDEAVRKSLLRRIDDYLSQSVETRSQGGKVSEGWIVRSSVDGAPIWQLEDKPTLTTTSKPTELSAILFEISRDEYGKKHSDLVKKLLELLEDPHIPHRKAAFSSISSLIGNEPCFGSESEPVKLVMSRISSRISARLKEGYLQTLGVIYKASSKTDDERILTVVTELLEEFDRSLRFTAAETLGRICRNDFKSTLTRLVQRFQNDICTCYFREALLQTMSSMALEMQRTRADNELKECQEILLQTFVEDLVQIMQEENMFVRIAILELLDCFCLRGSSVVGCVIQSLGDEERAVRERALEAISSLAEKGIITRDDEGTRRRRRELVPHMKHENWEIRRVAISASKVLFPNSPINVDRTGSLDPFETEDLDNCFASALCDSREELRRTACDALRQVASCDFSRCRSSVLHLLSVVDCRHKTVEKDKIGLKIKAHDEDGDLETGDEDTCFAEFERKCLEEGDFRLEEEIEETEVRIAGIKSLTALFDVSERKRVCRYLLYHLLDFHKAIRHTATTMIVRFDPSLSYSSAFVAMLCDTDANIRHEVADVLKGANRARAPALIVELGSLCQRPGSSKMDVSIRTQALQIVTSLASDRVSEQVVNVLKSCTEDPNPEVRHSAIQACQALASRDSNFSEQTMSLAMQLLDDGVWYVCLEAVRVVSQWMKEKSIKEDNLVRLGANSPVVKALMTAWNKNYGDDSKHVYAAVRVALMDICDLQNKSILDQVMNGLVNDDFEIRNSALVLIQSAFRQGYPVRPYFYEDYMSQSVELMGQVLQEYSQLDAEEGKQIEGGENSMRGSDINDESIQGKRKTLTSKLECILECLHLVVPHGNQTAIDCVIACLQQANHDVRSAAMKSLQKLVENNPSQVVPMTLPLLLHEDGHCRWVAKEAMMLFCPKGDRKAMADILKIMNHTDTFVRHAAVAAFISILLPQDLEAVVRALGDNHSKKELARMLLQISTLRSSMSGSNLPSDTDSFLNDLALQGQRLTHLEDTLNNQDWIRSSPNLEVREHDKLASRARERVANLWEEVREFAAGASLTSFTEQLESQGDDRLNMIKTRLKIQDLALRCMIAKMTPEGSRRAFFTSLWC